GLFGGWALGALAMYGLDWRYDTAWSNHYWSRIFGWGLQGNQHFEPSTWTFDLARQLHLAWTTLRFELRYSPLWTIPAWALIVWAVSRRYKFLLCHTVALISLIFYWVFMAPFMIANVKMPHWPVPIYPVLSLFLIS